MAQVVLFKSDNTGCGYYRADLPAKILLENGISTEVRFVKPTFRAYPETKVVFVQRHYIFIDVPILLRKFKRHGIKIIYDLDDDFFNLTPETNLYRVRENLLREIKTLASYADVMTVSTPRLKELSKRIFDGEIRVIPNMLDLDIWAPNRLKDDGRVRIGWAGSPTHSKDIMQIYSALKRILEDRPEVDLIFFGYCPKDFLEFGNRVSFVKGGSYDYFVDTFPRLGIDVGVIPIVESEFNISKSSVKFAEYCAIGLPTVVSNLPPYKEVVRDGVDGFLVSNKDQWYDKLMFLIEDQEGRSYISKNCQKRAEQFSIPVKDNPWVDLINNLLISNEKD